MAKWEYCMVGPVVLVADGASVIAVGRRDVLPCSLVEFTPEGPQSTSLPEGKPEGSFLSATISRLGGDGWELVGIAPYENYGHALYFKRSIS